MVCGENDSFLLFLEASINIPLQRKLYFCSVGSVWRQEGQTLRPLKNRSTNI